MSRHTILNQKRAARDRVTAAMVAKVVAPVESLRVVAFVPLAISLLSAPSLNFQAGPTHCEGANAVALSKNRAAAAASVRASVLTRYLATILVPSYTVSALTPV